VSINTIVCQLPRPFLDSLHRSVLFHSP